MIRAPMFTILSTKKSLFSNIFSKIRTVPCACVATASAIDVRSAGNCGHGPSSIFGIDVLDHDLARRHGAETDEARALDVIRADPPLAAAQAVDAAHPQHVRA